MLVDSVHTDPTINPAFSCKSELYWSSTTGPYYHNIAWLVDFSDGKATADDVYNGKGYEFYVRCVREGY
ncbi:DUF1566 domain-containing protein [Desulfovibrio inopinatus]|uniref:Lcl C-terminal domain-containing protein n=1 Tax=Desulfovibrio inopinatus TaxID=102109 RepID=UPI0009FCC9A2